LPNSIKKKLNSKTIPYKSPIVTMQIKNPKEIKNISTTHADTLKICKKVIEKRCT
jgi:hypothetical protein